MNLKSEAHNYREQGLAVIPVRGKTALIGWKEFQDKAPDASEINQMPWGQATGLAILLGNASNGLAVRDYDKYESYCKWRYDYREYADKLPTAETSRGRHVYFRHRVDSTEKYSDGELRGSGAYVVAPPSRHESGKYYKWDIPLTSGVPEINPHETGLTTEYNPPYSVSSNNNTLYTDCVRLCSIESDVSDVFDCVTNAVKYLPTGKSQNHHLLFQYAGHVKRNYPDCKPEELVRFFKSWYDEADKLFLRYSFDEYLTEFLEAYKNFKPELCEFDIDAVYEIAVNKPVPGCAKELGPYFQALTGLCRELQIIHGRKPFFLSCRKVQELMGLEYHEKAARMLNALCTLGILKRMSGGSMKNRQAAKYMYLKELTI